MKIESVLAQYRDALRKNPIRTKALTSCLIGLIGELIGQYIRSKKHVMPLSSKLKRLGVFGLYGLLVSGPVFHYWYGHLELLTRDVPLKLRILVKILVDRLAFTPPFLLFTLVFLQYLQTFSMRETFKSIRISYSSALVTNWKVWTIAQAINFSLIPLEYRVLFGNLIAMWWNTYLSLKN